MLNAEARQHLREVLPLDMVATKAWLKTQGLGVHFLDNAVRNQTLIQLAPGIYVRGEARLSWQGVVASLQRMSKAPVHVGGLSALELEGLGHYLPKGDGITIRLYSEVRLPNWVGRIDAPAMFEWHGTRRVWPHTIMKDRSYLRQEAWREALPPVLYSCPEKAVLELLSTVPLFVSCEHADQLMQGLHNLSPRKLNALLKVCQSVKAKRLFLWLAERSNHPWHKYLTPDEYELGVGKRQIVAGGRLEPTWQITIPREM